MKKGILAAAVALVALLLAAPAQSVYIAQPIGEYASDFAWVLSESAVGHIEEGARALDGATGIRIAFVTVDTTAPAAIEDYAAALSEGWKAEGAREYDEILVLLAIADNAYCTLVSFGVEDVLPAGELSELTDRHLKPDFDAGDYSSACVRYFDALLAEVAGAYGLDPSALGGGSPSATPGAANPWDEIFGMIGGEGELAALFPDPALREAIEAAARDASGRRDGEVTRGDLAAIEALNLSGRGIRDVSALSSLTGLKSLDLSGNLIEDVGPLAQLSRLTRLDLSGNLLVDIAPLEKLGGLTQLILADNGISDTSPLQALKDQGCYIVLRGNPTPRVLDSPPAQAPTGAPSSAPTPGPTSLQSVVASASDHYVSATHPENNWRYLPKGAADGDLGTAWTVRSPQGKWLELRVGDGAPRRVAGFRLLNGLHDSSTAFLANARVTRLNVYCDGALADVVEIRDSQYLETYRLQEPVDGALFRFEIAGCVGGTTSSDCGVCELELLGPDGFDIAPADGSFDAWGAAVRRAGQLALSGALLKPGSDRYAVMGLQTLLKEGFGVFGGGADGQYGAETQAAVQALMAEMQAAGLATDGAAGWSDVVDAATWKLMLEWAAALKAR